LLADSTNAEPAMMWNGGASAGDCLTEQQVYELLAKEISESSGRVIVSTFASHIDRIQQILKIVRNLKIAEKLGYLDGLGHRIVTSQTKQMIIASGSQGEPLSALVRISSGIHKRVRLERGAGGD